MLAKFKKIQIVEFLSKHIKYMSEIQAVISI